MAVKYKQIKLGKGVVTLVDAEDFIRLSKFKWMLACGYARRNNTQVNKRRNLPHWIHMHRVIVNAPGGVQVDHVNGNKLDNRKRNLRLATHSENARNVRIHCDNRTGFKGIYLHKHSNTYSARLCKDGVIISLGYYREPEAAYLAYCMAAQELFGEFARE